MFGLSTKYEKRILRMKLCVDAIFIISDLAPDTNNIIDDHIIQVVLKLKKKKFQVS